MAKNTTKAPKVSAYDNPEIKNLPEIRADTDTGSSASEPPVVKKGTFKDPVTGITVTHN